MSRLALGARLGLIAVCLVAVAGMLVSAMAYRLNDMDRLAAPPSPDRVLGIVRLYEALDREGRADMEAALAVGLAPITVEHGPLVPDPLSPDLSPVPETLAAPFRQVLAPRALALYQDHRDLAWLVRLHPNLDVPLMIRVDLGGGEVLVLESRPTALFSRYGLPIGLPAGLIGTLIALGALLLVRRDTRPLADLTRAMEAMDPAKGPLSFPPSRRRGTSREVGALTRAFDRLQARTATLTAARMALLGGLQHDIRAFATRLRLRAHAIPDPNEREAADRDITDMITLLDDALLASRAGAGDLAMDLELLVPHELIARDVAPLSLAATPEARSARVLADRLALRRVVANLVDNARHHGQGRVALRLVVEQADLVLTVDDGGPGIPEAARALIMEPFTRLEASRARGTGGAGLGLAVARGLVDALGGALSIGEAPELGGARLTLRLPLYADEGGKTPRN